MQRRAGKLGKRVRTSSDLPEILKSPGRPAGRHTYRNRRAAQPSLRPREKALGVVVALADGHLVRLARTKRYCRGRVTRGQGLGDKVESYHR